MYSVDRVAEGPRDEPCVGLDLVIDMALLQQETGIWKNV